MTIAAGELEEFRRILKAHGLAAADFDLAKEEQPPRAMFFREEGLIRVSHRPTGTVRTYSDSPGSNWVADFKRDLEQHVFDP